MKTGNQKLLDERAGHCWSFGSTNRPSSQSRKISIGVMVDSLPKKASGGSKERDSAVKDGKSATMRSNGKGVMEEQTPSKKPKQTEVVNLVNSPWVSPKKSYVLGNTSEIILSPDRTPDLPASGRTKLDGVNSEASVLPSDNDRTNKFCGVTYERRHKKDRAATDRMQDFTFATAQDVPISDMEIIKNKISPTETGKTVNLRLRLHEILGAISSPKDHHSESPTPDLGADISSPEHRPNKMGDTVGKPAQSSDKQEHKSEEKGDAPSKPMPVSNKQKEKVARVGNALFKPRQNSDSIETDSECSDHRVERPVTRSLARKKAPTKVVRKKTTKNEKMKPQEKNISSHANDGGSSSMLTRKKCERKSFKVKPLNLFKERNVAEKIQQATLLTVSPPPARKTNTYGTVHSNVHLSDKDRDCQLKSIPINNPLSASPTDDEDNPDNFENRGQPEHIVAPPERRRENTRSPSIRKSVEQEDVPQSPTFRFNSPALNSFPSPTPKSDMVREIRSFSSKQGKKIDCSSYKQIESSDDEDEHIDSHTRKASSIMKDSPTEAASSDDSSSQNSEEYSPTTDEFDPENLEPTLRPAKQHRNKGINIRLKRTKISSPSFKGRRESNWIPKETSEPNEADGLTRALELFASELEKIRSKIKSATSKKSSEILMSVAADVHQQLQNAETHVQKDMGKLQNLSNLKRKRVETRFEEQQERLQLIYSKFKEQINQHLQDCKTTFEGLEADQKELKGTLEKRRSSHRKLLLQVEESVETQLNEAQKKITATQEAARKKMGQLKQVLGLCLKDDIMS